jgi:endonuclease III
MKNAHAILEKLCVDPRFKDYWFKWSETEKPFTTIREASVFFINVMLDQGGRWEVAKSNAKYFVENYFPEESIWKDIKKKDLDSLEKICKKGNHNGKGFASRFMHEHFHNYLQKNAELIVNRYKADPRNIWSVTAENVELIYHRLLEFHGIGDALAKMGQFTLVRKYGIAGGKESKQHLRAKPDIHVSRVLYRMGLSENEKPASAVRCIDAAGVSSQADLDAVLVSMGRKFCKKTDPKCADCPLKRDCDKRLP